MSLKCQCPPHPRDGPWAWLVCIGGTISNFLLTAVLSSYAIFLPVLVEQFNENREKTAWAGSIAISVMCVVGPIPVILSHGFGHRPVAIAGGLVCVLSLLTSSFATGIGYLYFTYGALFGLGAGCHHTCSLIVSRKYFTAKKQSLGVGIILSGGSIGVMVMAPSFQVLVDTIGWRNTFRVMSGVMIIIALVGVTYDTNIENDDEAPRSEQVLPMKLSSFINFSLYKNATYSIGTITVTLAQMGFHTPGIHLIKFAKELGIPATKSAQLFICIGVLSTISRILVGRVLDKKWLTPLHGVQLSVFIMGAALIAQAFAKTFPHLVVFAVSFGVGNGGFVTAQAVFFQSSVEPRKSAMGLGMGYMAKSLGIGGPPVVGFIADKFDSYIPSFYVIGGILLFAAALPFLLLMSKSPKSGQELIRHNRELIGENDSDKLEVPLYETSL